MHCVWGTLSVQHISSILCILCEAYSSVLHALCARHIALFSILFVCEAYSSVLHTLCVWGTQLCSLPFACEAHSSVLYPLHVRHTALFSTLCMWGTQLCSLPFACEAHSSVLYTLCVRHTALFLLSATCLFFLHKLNALLEEEEPISFLPFKNLMWTAPKQSGNERWGIHEKRKSDKSLSISITFFMLSLSALPSTVRTTYERWNQLTRQVLKRNKWGYC